jgi:hypothetical protein
MPDITFPQIDINKTATDVNNALREGAYFAVGLGVLGFQRAQVRRVELTKQLESQLSQLTQLPQLPQLPQLSGLSDLPTAISKQFEAYRKQAVNQAEQFTGHLADRLTGQVSGQFSSASKLLEDQAEAIRGQLAELAKTVDERVQPARKQLDEQIDRLEERLPAGARTVVQTVRAAAAAPEQLIRTAAGL